MRHAYAFSCRDGVLRRGLTWVAALLLGSLSARADTETCARALDEAERLHAAGKLHDAIRAMDACTQCAALSDVCAATGSALRAAVPTLTVTVRDCGGDPVPDAAVFVDGARAEQGRRIELDPGPHTVRAELAGRSEEQTVLVAEHESRRAALLLPAPARPRPMPASAIVIGATSGVAFAAAAGLWAWSDTIPTYTQAAGPVSSLSRTDQSAALQQTHDPLALAAGITLSFAITGLVTAVILYVLRPSRGPGR
jgi:hypothetical protein